MCSDNLSVATVTPDAGRRVARLKGRQVEALVEVFEVATFYHYFENWPPPPLGQSVRVITAPCIGRCEQAPAVLVGQKAVPHAEQEQVVDLVESELNNLSQGFVAEERSTDFVALEAYRRAGGSAMAAANLLTNAALDPVGKIPEFKYCAVSIASARESGGLIT